MGGSGYEPPYGTARRGASAEDRQTGMHQLLWLSYLTKFRGSLFADQRQTLDSEQSLGSDPMLAFWRISGLVLPKCQSTEVTTSAPGL